MRARIVSCSTHLLAAFLVLAAASPPAGAQSSSARGVVDGVVTDTSLAPLAHAAATSGGAGGVPPERSRAPLADAVESIVGSAIRVVPGAPRAAERQSLDTHTKFN